MKNKLEQLLNSLIEKGWCPIGKEYTGPHKPFISSDEDRVHGKLFYYNEYWDGGYRLQKVFTLREIVSINSGLWQFVCENGMLETKGNVRVKNYWGDDECDDNCCDDDLEYWLIESALCDEDKLEEFLLSNIKVEG